MGTTKNTFRTQVFKRAYAIAEQTKQSFKECLSQAWKLYRLTKKLLKNEEVEFSYLKKDGSTRKAFGTLKNVSQFIKGTGTPNFKVFNYWDLDAVAFRCFKVENFIA